MARQRSRADVQTIVERLREKTGRDLYVGYAHGGARLHQRISPAGEHDISPRLRIGRLYEWLQAFEEGVGVGYEKGQRDLRRQVSAVPTGALFPEH